MIKVISLDLWVTLIKGNPEFKKARAAFLASYTTVAESKIEEYFSKVDTMWTEYEERYNDRVILSHIRFATVFHHLGIDSAKYCYDYLQKHIEDLFISLGPNVIPEGKAFLASTSLRIIIASNTGFMSTEVLMSSLTKEGVKFHSFVGSDQAGVCKPNRRFFERVLTKTNDSSLVKSEIIHVGDNSFTDIAGAKSIGFHTFLIDHEKMNYTALQHYISLL